MKKPLVIIALLFCSMVFSTSTQASVASGGELVYFHIQDSTYQFFVKLYRDCSGAAAPNSVPLCMTNTCTSTKYSYTMQKWTGTIPGPWGPGCPNIKTTCDSPGSSIPGYQEYWYSTIVTLPTRCTEWKFFSYIANRNAGSTNIQNSSSTTLYLEATFNNTISHNNSSPFFTIRPNPYYFQNQNTTFNMGASDSDADSLVTQMIHPRTGVTTCSGSPTNVTYTSQSPSISIPNNPFQTNNSFALNSYTGQASFTPTQLGKNSIVFVTKEYRNGSLIGSAMREMQVQVVQQNGSNPSSGFKIGCGVTPTGPGNKVYVCSGQALSFCLDAFSSDTAAKLHLFDNKNVVTPTASVSYTNQGTDTAKATFSWTPTINDAGPHTLAFTLHDSTCRLPGIIHMNYYVLDIYVWGSTTASADTAICPLPGSFAQLNVTGGGNFSWTILPGGTPNSLNNPNLPNPRATPTVKTTYAVVSNASSYCPDNKDTVTVDILPTTAITNPSISISVSPDSNILAGTSVTFTANSSGCNNPSYQWAVNGVNDPLGIGPTFTTNKLKNLNIVTCKISCNDICPAPKDTISNTITMHVTSSISSLNKKEELITIYPNPNNGVFNININELVYKNNTAGIEISNLYGQKVYSTTLKKSQNLIELNTLPAGMYILKANIENKSIVVRFTIE